MLKIAMIAGEPSGDVLGAGMIMQLCNQYQGEIEFFGIGAEKMAEQGFKSAHDMSILSVGGFGFEVLKAIPRIYLLYRTIVKQIIAFKPDVFIGIDAPDFNFHVEKKLKLAGIKTVHYISPTIWAWRYERIYKIKQTTDLMLCVFPMEEPLYLKEGIKAKFIGHPLADQIEMDVDQLTYKVKLNLSGEVFCVLVGSRSLEIKNLTPIFIETCNLIAAELPDITFLFPLASQKVYTLFDQLLLNYKLKFKYKLLLNETADAIKASTLVLSKSGTVSLEVALCKKPMVISYKINKLTEWIVRRRATIKYAGLPNILLNEAVVPELLQSNATPEKLAHTMLGLYHNQLQREQIVHKFYGLHKQLKLNANEKAALAVLELINNDK